MTMLSKFLFSKWTLQPKCDLQLDNSNDAMPTTTEWNSHHGGFAQLRVHERLPKESLCDGNDSAVNYSCSITPVNNLAWNYLGIYFVNYDGRAHLVCSAQCFAHT